MLGFEASIAAAAVPPWHEMINGPADDKLAQARRPRVARRPPGEAWDNPLPEQNSFRNEQLDIFILTDSENGTGPVDISLKDLAEQRGVHPSDALADWVLANGIGSRYTKLSSTVVPLTDEQTPRDDDREPRTTRSRSSAAPTPARTSRCSAARARTSTCSRTGRATRTRSSIEQAVHCMTQRDAPSSSRCTTGA